YVFAQNIGMPLAGLGKLDNVLGNNAVGEIVCKPENAGALAGGVLCRGDSLGAAPRAFITSAATARARRATLYENVIRLPLSSYAAVAMAAIIGRKARTWSKCSVRTVFRKASQSHSMSDPHRHGRKR